MFSKRQIQLLRYLWESDNYISLEMLSDVFGVTFRTIRNDIEEIEESISIKGATINKKPGIGYKLEVLNYDEFERFKDSINQNYISGVIIPHYNIEENRYIIRRILLSEDGVREEEIQKELLLSESSTKKNIDIAKEVLKKYHLTISSLPYHGLIIKGKEKHIRWAMCDFLFLTDEDKEIINYKTKEIIDYENVKGIIKEECIKYDYRISMNSLMDLSKLLCISCQRYIINPVRIKTELIKESKTEINIAASIYNRLGYNMSKTELDYFALCLRSRKSYSLRDEYIIEEYDRYLKMCEDAIVELKQSTGIDFLNDWDLKKLIAFELKSMIVRLSEGYEYKNISFLRMKTAMPTYNYAVIMMRKLVHDNNWYVSDSEISVLAIIIHRSISKYNINYKKKKIGLIFSDGFINSRILYNLLKNNFDRYIDKVEAEEYISYNPNDNKYDVIMSDLSKGHFYQDNHSFYQYLNVFDDKAKKEIKNLLTDRVDEVKEFVNSIKHFYKNVECKDKNYFMEKVLNEIDFDEKGDTTKESIVEREEFSSCENSYGIAVCQTFCPIVEKTSIDIITLKKKILWQEEYVKLVFVVCNGKTEKYPFMIQNLINLVFKKPVAIYEVLQAQSIEDIEKAIQRAVL